MSSELPILPLQLDMPPSLPVPLPVFWAAPPRPIPGLPLFKGHSPAAAPPPLCPHVKPGAVKPGAVKRTADIHTTAAAAPEQKNRWCQVRYGELSKTIVDSDRVRLLLNAADFGRYIKRRDVWMEMAEDGGARKWTIGIGRHKLKPMKMHLGTGWRELARELCIGKGGTIHLRPLGRREMRNGDTRPAMLIRITPP